MIAGSFVDKLILSVQWLPDHHWSEWEILTFSMTILFLLVWITKLQRGKKVRRKYQNQFLESTTSMGMSWGTHNKSRQAGKDLRKERLSLIHKNQNIQQFQTKESSEKPIERMKKLHSSTSIHPQIRISLEHQISRLMADNQEMQPEQTKPTKPESQINKEAEYGLLQEEIIKLQSEIAAYKQANENFEQQVSELKADNEKLQQTLIKFEQTESQNKQQLIKLKKIHEENKLLQNEINTHKQAKESFEQKVSELTVDNEILRCELTKLAKAESRIDEMTTEHEHLQEEIKKLQNEISTHKQAKECFEQQVSELTADNEKLQYELTELAKAESEVAMMTAELRQIQKENFQAEQISQHQIVTEPVVEKPVSRTTAKRNIINKQQHRTVEGIRQKLCKKCNEWKPESEFHKNSSSKDNLAADCKICKNNAAKQRRKQLKTAQK